MVEKFFTDEVFGVTRDLPLNYVSRDDVDGKLIDNLTRNHHIVIYGSSKQGKTCLRKYCLKETDYVVVSCQNRWNLGELHAAILKEAGYVVKLSSSRTISGNAKIMVSAEGKVGIPLIAEGKTGGEAEAQGGLSRTETVAALELDPYDVNDIIRALQSIDFKKFIVLEDFHYLPDETQRDFAFALKAFHEKSRICFIIVGVWREQNRLIAYNGDLTDRVFSVDVDGWEEGTLGEVIKTGEALLNIQFEEAFKKNLIDNCFKSVHIVQEACRRCCRRSEVYKTCDELTVVGQEQDAKDLIKAVVDEQSGRYQGFLMNFADGFQQTDLEMPRWIIFAILTFATAQLESGVRLRELSRRIKFAHLKGNAAMFTLTKRPLTSFVLTGSIRWDTTGTGGCIAESRRGCGLPGCREGGGAPAHMAGQGAS